MRFTDNTIIRIVIAMSAAVCLLAGCGEKGSSSQNADSAFTPKLDTSEEATVNIIGSLDNFESLEAVITDFEEYYPNCNVIYSRLDSYSEMLEPRLRSDDSVGIFIVSDYQSEFIKEACADLSKEDIDLSTIKPEVISSCTVDGKLYEIPLALSTSGLLVNTTILEKEGLSLPTNYEEFMDVCAALKEKGYTPIQGESWTTGKNLISNMAYMLLSGEYGRDNSLEPLETGAEGCADVLEPAFEKLGEIVGSGYIDPEVNSLYEDNYNDLILKFFEGDVPFAVGNSVTFSGTKKRESKSEHFVAEPFEYEFICAPIAEEGSYNYIENWEGFAVNENCPDKKWAVEFMRFLYTKEEINKLASIKGLPSVAVESDDDRFSDLFSGSEETFYMGDSYFPGVVDRALSWTCREIIDEKTGGSEAAERMREFLNDPQLMTEE